MAGRGRMLPALLALLCVVAISSSVVAVSAGSTTAADSTTESAEQSAVVARRLIGRSVQGRPIFAYRLGEPAGKGVPKVLLISGMHGDEGAPRKILTALRDGLPVMGAELWLLPAYNPDGLAAGTRRNAHGVDLNRNFPHDWADLDGSYESGPRPGSEPETRAVMRFLTSLRPRWLISFHQPLYGVDTDTKRPRFSRRVARALDLPRKRFDCGGVCHGTMTSWFNATFKGAAVTVEYGYRPSIRTLRRQAPRRLLRLFGAFHGTADWVDPHPGLPPQPSPSPTPTGSPSPTPTAEPSTPTPS
ncbi:M14 family zinc carboxypeptidase [Nocardioides ferulae]|uniref:M14 family zinc carboxypeptidase n=1 Tax=Nocardioides ferulae TaxID=2340821 RepID=UPI000EB19076|nr:M14 family zinc carboxypeptidase [Nocardioides ferulae]